MSVVSSELEHLLPTDDEVAAYRVHGWYVSRRIFSDEVLDAAIEASERFYRGEVPCRDDIPERFVPHPPLHDGLRKHDYASMSVPELYAIVSHPVLAAIGARLMGSAEVRLWHDQLLYKPPSADRSGNVGWHTDRSYWKACSSEDMVTAWVPFHTITQDHGPLTLIDGSSRWGREDKGKPDFFRQDIEVQEEEISRDSGRTITKVPVLLERGQVSFHHCRTFHGSGPNVSGEPRRSIAVHLQPGENRASDERTPEGEPIWHANNDLVRWVDGVPDFTDPRWCPVLYP